MPTRSARIRICCSLSSPETYSILMPFACRATCNIRVDLPIPGSPPNKTNDPGTMPPPKILSNSLSLVEKRCSFSTSISFINKGLRARPRDVEPLLFLVSFTTISSTIVFHASQEGHLPSHLADWQPQL